MSVCEEMSRTKAFDASIVKDSGNLKRYFKIMFFRTTGRITDI